MAEKNKKVRIITHNGSFHPDEVCAVAVLDMLFEGKAEIVRSRDDGTIKTGDFIVDVGRKYDPERNMFDHHQPEGAGKRENGIPYAAFGLIWKHFGEKLTGSQEIVDRVDEEMVQPIDAIDNGVKITEKTEYKVKNYSFGNFIDSLNPGWNEEEADKDERFSEAVGIAKRAIERIIAKNKRRIEARPIVERFYKEAEDKRIIVMDGLYSWKETVLTFPEPLYVIFPETSNRKWITYAVPKEKGEFERRKPFPKEWAGKQKSELSRVTGVSDAHFCHRGLFICVSESKEGAIELAKIAAES